MKVVMLDAPASMLEERRRLGLDRSDEMWEGVLHMAPPPSHEHQYVGIELLLVLAVLAKRVGLQPYYDGTGVFRGHTDYRVPDHVYARPEQASERGIEGGPALVVELRSPHDETYEKLDWYAEIGTGEVLVVHGRERRVELFRNVEGRMLPVTANGDGSLRCEALRCTFITVPGPRLRITWEDGAAEI